MTKRETEFHIGKQLLTKSFRDAKLKFIICDEPVLALDVSIQAQILNLLMDLQEQRELSYMFITHDLCVVKHISDEIMVMYMGQVVEHAKTAELFANPVHPYTKALLHAVPTIDLSRRNREGFMLRGEVTSPHQPRARVSVCAPLPLRNGQVQGECLPEGSQPGSFCCLLSLRLNHEITKARHRCGRGKPPARG